MPEQKPPSSENAPSHLDSLEHRLYSRNPPPLKSETFGQEEHHIRIAPGWTEEAERKNSALVGIIGTIMPWLKRLFIASILFALFAGGIALYGFWRGGNTVSPQNISLSVLGPVAAAAGEELVFEVNVGNYNEQGLESVGLLVEYPDGTRKPSDVSEPLLRYRESLGTLEPGGTLSRRLSVVPFGEEGEKKTVRLTIEYRPRDSNAIFSRKGDYEFTINASPLTLILANPKEVNSGGSFEIAVDVSSNSSTVLKDLLLKAEYPTGFQFDESSPSPTFGNDLWLLGDLRPEGKRTLRIKGRIDATEEEERAFRFSLGTQSSKNEKALGTVFLSSTESVIVKRAFVNLDFVLNGEKGKTFVAKGTGPYRADIAWKNNLATKIADLQFTAVLEGSIFNRDSVQSLGFYDSNTATIFWDKRGNNNLSAVEPGKSGTLSFNFSLLPVATDPALYKNPSMQIHVFARGKRLDEQGAYQEVVSTFTKEVKVASLLSLSAQLLHTEGAFENQGPVPPQAEQETTYTVVWSLSNSSNGVSEAEVKAILPSYVKWLGEVSDGEDVTYGQVGGEVVWHVGDVPSGTGIGTSPREVSFKISIQPSTSQVGTAPVLIGESRGSAQDRFTNVAVQSNTRPALTTNSLGEATGRGAVQKASE